MRNTTSCLPSTSLLNHSTLLLRGSYDAIIPRFFNLSIGKFECLNSGANGNKDFFAFFILFFSRHNTLTTLCVSDAIQTSNHLLTISFAISIKVCLFFFAGVFRFFKPRNSFFFFLPTSLFSSKIFILLSLSK